jgi:hypothetical protein
MGVDYMSAPIYVAVGTQVAGTTNQNAVWPAGHQIGDLGILVIETGGEGTTLTPPAGWTAVPGSPVTSVATTAGSKLQVWYKFAVSTTEANVATGDSGDHQIARIYTFRDVTQTGTFNASTTGTKTTASTTVTWPSITTTEDNTLVVFIATRPDDTNTNTNIFGSYTQANLDTTLIEAAEATTSAGHGGGFVVAYATKASAGATGTPTASMGALSVTNAYLVFALATKSFDLIANTRSYTLTGNDVTLNHAARLTADTTSYTLNGNDVTLTKTTPAKILTADVATFIEDLKPANLTVGRKLVSATGAFRCETNIAAAVFSDDFNRADAANLGANWNITQGGFSVTSNKVYGNITDYRSIALPTANYSSDQAAKITISGDFSDAADHVGVGVRLSAGVAADYRTWTELDPTSVLSKAPEVVTISSMNAVSDTGVHGVWYDGGTNWKTGDFWSSVGAINVSSASTDTARFIIAGVTSSNTSGTGSADNNRPSIQVRWVKTALSQRVELVQYRSTDNLTSSPAASDFYEGSAVALNTPFYIELERIGSVANCRIYSNASHTTLVDTLTISLTEVVSMRYYYVAGKYTTGSSATVSATIGPVNLDVPQTGYVFRGDGFSDGGRTLLRLCYGNFATLGAPALPITNGDTVEVRAVGARISVYINDILKYTATDTLYTSGKPGIHYEWSNTRDVFLDDFYSWNIVDTLTLRKASNLTAETSTYTEDLKPANLLISRKLLAIGEQEQQVFTDNFERADQALDSTSAWLRADLEVGSLSIVSGKAVGTNIGNVYNQTLANNQWAEISFGGVFSSGTGKGAAILLRATGGQSSFTGYAISLERDNSEAGDILSIRRVLGATTYTDAFSQGALLASTRVAEFASNSPDTIIRAEIIDGIIYAYVNGVLALTNTASGSPVSGFAGMWSDTATISTFSAGGIGPTRLTLNNANLLVTRKLIADSRSYTEDLQPANLIYAARLTADVQTYDLIEKDATLTYTPNPGSTYTLALDVFSFTTTLNPAGLNKGFYLTLSSSSFSLTRYNNILTPSRYLSLARATFEITGPPPLLVGIVDTHSITINPPAGWALHLVTDVSQAGSTTCIYYNVSPAVAVGDQILHRTTTETNSNAVSVSSTGIVSTVPSGSDTLKFRHWRPSTWSAELTYTVASANNYSLTAETQSYTLAGNVNNLLIQRRLACTLTAWEQEATATYLVNATRRDLFNGYSNGTDLSFVPGWSRLTGSAGSVIVNSDGKVDFISTTDSAYAISMSSANHFAEFTYGIGGDNGSYYPVAIRITDASNWIGVRCVGTGGLQLHKCVAGTFTLLGSYADYGSSTVGDSIRLEGVGNELSVYVNGVRRIYAIDSAHNTVTKAGLVARSQSRADLIETMFFGLSQSNKLLAQRTVSCVLSSYTLTRNDTNLNHAARLTADTRSYDLTFRDANLLRGERLTADTRAYDLTLRDANFNHAARLTADTRSYDLTLRDANLNHAASLTADTRSYDLTLRDANLNHAARLTADTRSYSLIGNSASLSSAGVFGPISRQYFLTGNIILFRRSIIHSAGSYSLNTNPANLNKGERLTADTRSYDLTLRDANLNHAARLTADTRSYDLTFRDANLLRGERLTADTRSYTLTLRDANLNHAARLTANTRSYDLTFRDANLLRGERLTADTRSYDLTLRDANLNHAARLTADTRSYDLTRNDANLLRGERLTADTRSYDLTLRDANLNHAARLTTDTRSYNLGSSPLIVKVDRKLIADSRIYILTAYALSFASAGVLAGNTRTYIVTGNTVTFLRTVRVTLETGTISLAQQSANLAASKKISLDKVDYSLSTTSVLFNTGKRVSLSQGSYSLTGSDIKVKRSIVLITRSYSITANTINLLATRKLQATVSSYSISGTPVVTLVNRKVQAITAIFDTNGYVDPGYVDPNYTSLDVTIKITRKISCEFAVFNLTVNQANIISKGGLVKIWTGSAWTSKPMKVWTGTAWVTKPLKIWDGATWRQY